MSTTFAHTSEIWCLAVTKHKYNLPHEFDRLQDDSFVVTIGHDKNIRLFKRTRDIVFPDEERQKLMSLDTQNLGSLKNIGNVQNDSLTLFQSSNAQTNVFDDNLNTDNVPGLQVLEEKRGEVINSVTVQTNQLQTEKMLTEGDKLLQAISFFSEESTSEIVRDMAILKVYKLSKEQYLVKVLAEMKSSEMDYSLMMLPFNATLMLLDILGKITENEIALDINLNLHVERLMTIIVKLLRFNFKQIVASQDKNLVTNLKSLKLNLRARLSQAGDRIGTNIAGLKYIKDKLKANRMPVE